MKKQQSVSPHEVKYALDAQGCFVIENYNQSKPFSNFFPGIAGLWGIPMWVFYVNRAQCVTSFGIEAKDKAIMEFQPANKSYRQTALKGFRTFIKVKSGADTIYWEPFQNYLLGTDFKKKQKLYITAHDLTLEETNFDLGLIIRVNYFTLPEEPYAALVRRVSIRNIGKTSCQVELIDGLPMIVPYGLKDWAIKNMARTVEAWVKVRNLKKNAPYYQLNVEVSDKPEVTHIKEGNFYFSFDPDADSQKPLPSIVEASCVFGQAVDFIAPVNFLAETFQMPDQQQTSNRTPSAMSYIQYTLAPHQEKEIVSFLGYARSEDQLNRIVKQVSKAKFIHRKADRNREIIEEIKNFALTKSASDEFNLYAGHTFLDNILRGGLPITVKTQTGHVTFNVYSRKHGDLERDYNYFVVAPTFYSQGNGNYRDVNQNRRNDVWFNRDVRDSHLINFLSLIQTDGYNPLIVKGATFRVEDPKKLDAILKSCLKGEDLLRVKEFLQKEFLPGALLEYVIQNQIELKIPLEQMFSQILGICVKQESADHGEGFWTDHWTYNLDLIESYLALFPEDLGRLLMETKAFSFYQNSHYVLPRAQRYILTDKGVRQYHSVAEPDDEEKEKRKNKDKVVRIKNGQGAVYYTYLTGKLLCLIANKAASFDPSGVGIEMEADKPNWYDAINGLPGLLGSSVSEMVELKRLSVFVSEALKQMGAQDSLKIPVFEELASFVTGLTHVLSTEANPLVYWNKANDLKEHYRHRVRGGIDGRETTMRGAEIQIFLNLVIQRSQKAMEAARNNDGFLATYFYHEVTEHVVLDKGVEGTKHFVRPVKFKRHALPLFLEGYVHALRTVGNEDQARALYKQVRQSPLFDRALKMYKVNADLSKESEEIGRTRIFPAGWLENESIWLHMEYKFILELLRNGLYEEFYENFRNVLIPFLKAETYGRSILENSSFLASSAHEDASIHGQGFVARLSGSTAEFLHLWILMNVGRRPFSLNAEGKLILQLAPVLAGWLFTDKKSRISFFDRNQKWQAIELPENVYAFNLLGSTLVVYHNPTRADTFGKNKVSIHKIRLIYPKVKQPVTILSPIIPEVHAKDIRDRKLERIDVYFE
ncbi:MAG TPA: hypothetical protein DD723_06325 [Candidatus Omnitrophica bacterium]|nr:MAG: hypothetical protein A2Z81_07760 [Omnitrophica WOR_2 bacterium GWA2_45_18]HBR15141.1 hypothetical protein [Candidatus Omnitrophota bacterium]